MIYLLFLEKRKRRRHDPGTNGGIAGHQWQWQGDVGADTCVRVGTCQMVVPDAPGELWLDLTLEHDHLVATNRYTCTITA